jgi:hypothetical protein
MKIKLILVTIFTFLLSNTIYSQNKLFFNRIHYFEHQECEHPIGTVIYDKVFFGNNTDNSSFLNFNNSKSEVVYVDLTNYGSYTAFNQFVKNNFLGANNIMMGFKMGVPSISESIKQARSGFKLDKVKDTTVNDKKLKHIRIKPKDTLAHRYGSYNILININTSTEKPLYTSPTVHFLLLGSLKDLKGTVVETYFIDLQGYRFCRDVLLGFEVTNRRVLVK